VRPPATPAHLFGSGMIVVNPPYVLEDELRALLPALAGLLGQDGTGRHRLQWVRAEL
jgi:23S rRNA (adenine2030-N6)-methyltransferase